LTGAGSSSACSFFSAPIAATSTDEGVCALTKNGSFPSTYDWRRRIQACVTIDKMVFAGNDDEKAYAFGLLTYFRKKQIAWSEVKNGFKHYFATRTNDKNKVKEQMALVKAYFRCWL
jgi:hypothetical protein